MNKFLAVTDKEKTAWEQFVSRQEHAPFLQSWAFGAFHEKVGNKVWRLASFQDENLVGVCLIVKLKTKLGSFLYVPWGPKGEWNQEKLIVEVRKLAKDANAGLIRFDPRDESFSVKGRTLKKAPHFTQPETTALLSLKVPLEQIRQGLSESTRYNVGWVERQGVRVEISQNSDDIEIFNSLLKETARRQGFQLYNSQSYYQEQFKAFAQSGQAKLFIAREPKESGNTPLASAIVIYYGDTVTYLHAASSSSRPKLRAPYLMQWKIIEDAKKNGFSWYDFWGVAKTNGQKDPWAGVTSFKLSFGGERHTYKEPVDLVTSKNYYLLSLLERLRKPFRNLSQ